MTVGSTTEGLRVVVVDDHPVFRAGLRYLLEELDVTVVAEAQDGAAGVEAVLEHRPDVVLMDLQMPGVGGIDATRQLLARWPEAKVLVLTMVDDDQAIFAAIRAGALGYLLKGAGQEEVGRALVAVAAGEGVYGPTVARRLRSFFGAGPTPSPALPFPSLSEREREVLDLIASGASNGAISQRLFLSEKTVRNYVSSIFAKLDVENRSEAIVRAREAGLGQPQA
ncbi:response regulator transcription factor [Nocardioides caldifontis]|uniref:response regulator transcription factor n=1 Tax=Nocardioides caldifontis TaxID=2588938 RepID=UPI001EF13BE0|nr:response regulator transcription factor [Nocardioides caldifontis]